MSDGYTAQQSAKRSSTKKSSYIVASGAWLDAQYRHPDPLIPVWLLVGYFFHQKQFDHLSCVLTDRSINIRSGLLFKNSRTSHSTRLLTSQLWVAIFGFARHQQNLDRDSRLHPVPANRRGQRRKVQDVVLQHRDQQATAANQPRPLPRLLTMCWSRFATSSRASRPTPGR